mmetsp:Transcript_6664/g.19032  ORF Transcript_6664/g.19032 Transcript_6664/m.19032 type:complete len:369 (+) Transcript_6664:557-1663(+)
MPRGRLRQSRMRSSAAAPSELEELPTLRLMSARAASQQLSLPRQRAACSSSSVVLRCFPKVAKRPQSCRGVPRAAMVSHTDLLLQRLRSVAVTWMSCCAQARRSLPDPSGLSLASACVRAMTLQRMGTAPQRVSRARARSDALTFLSTPVAYMSASSVSGAGGASGCASPPPRGRDRRDPLPAFFSEGAAARSSDSSVDTGGTPFTLFFRRKPRGPPSRAFSGSFSRFSGWPGLFAPPPPPASESIARLPLTKTLSSFASRLSWKHARQMGRKGSRWPAMPTAPRPQTTSSWEPKPRAPPPSPKPSSSSCRQLVMAFTRRCAGRPRKSSTTRSVRRPSAALRGCARSSRRSSAARMRGSPRSKTPMTA